jgi:hypothetical protein
MHPINLPTVTEVVFRLDLEQTKVVVPRTDAGIIDVQRTEVTSVVEGFCFLFINITNKLVPINLGRLRVHVHFHGLGRAVLKELIVLVVDHHDIMDRNGLDELGGRCGIGSFVLSPQRAPMSSGVDAASSVRIVDTGQSTLLAGQIFLSAPLTDNLVEHGPVRRVKGRIQEDGDRRHLVGHMVPLGKAVNGVKVIHLHFSIVALAVLSVLGWDL